MSELYTYDDVKLKAVKLLNTRVLNSSFKKLQSNDNNLIPLNDYVPNTWERKWFNDDNINGYSAGDCVWKYIFSEDEFLDLYGDAVYGYCQGKNTLKAVIDKRWADVKYSKKLSAKYKSNYENVISGYTNITYDYLGHLCATRLYDSIFDYGNRTGNERIEIYMSTIDNNKYELSNTSYWHNAIISDYTQYKTFIESEISTLFKSHINDYHLGGLKTYSEFNEKLLKNNLSNFDIDEVYNKIQIKNHSYITSQDGIDYVIRYAKKETDISCGDQIYKTYKFFRLWNSGYLEHFGIIKNPIFQSISSENPEDCTIKIDLNWKYMNKDDEYEYADVYDYEEMSSNDTIYNSLYYGQNYIERIDNSLYLGNKYRYSVNITPIVFNISNDIIDDKIISFDELKKTGYIDYYTESKNKSYFNIEVHHIKKDSFCITKNNINDFTQDKPIQFYSYHTSGYKIQQSIKNWLYFTAEEEGSTITLNKSNLSSPAITLQYSKDGNNWINYSWNGILGTTITLNSIGDKVYFRSGYLGNTTLAYSDTKYHQFIMTGKITSGGNIMSILDQSMDSNSLEDKYNFAYLFSGCSALTKTPFLPATILTDGCYISMFSNCTQLSSIKVGFTSWSPNTTTNWLENVNTNGLFICPNDLSDIRGNSNIPTDWVKKST